MSQPLPALRTLYHKTSYFILFLLPPLHHRHSTLLLHRERKDELPQMQVSFIDLICLPLYKMMSDTFPWIRPLYYGTLDNRNHWQDLAEKVEMG